jgi:hypothetical protein
LKPLNKRFPSHFTSRQAQHNPLLFINVGGYLYPVEN